MWKSCAEYASTGARSREEEAPASVPEEDNLSSRQAALRTRVLPALTFMLGHFEALKQAEIKVSDARLTTRLVTFVAHLETTIQKLSVPASAEELTQLQEHLERTLLPVKERLELKLSTARAAKEEEPLKKKLKEQEEEPPLSRCCSSSSSSEEEERACVTADEHGSPQQTVGGLSSSSSSSSPSPRLNGRIISGSSSRLSSVGLGVFLAQQEQQQTTQEGVVTHQVPASGPSEEGSGSTSEEEEQQLPYHHLRFPSQQLLLLSRGSLALSRGSLAGFCSEESLNHAALDDIIVDSTVLAVASAASALDVASLDQSPGTLSRKRREDTSPVVAQQKQKKTSKVSRRKRSKTSEHGEQQQQQQQQDDASMTMMGMAMSNPPPMLHYVKSEETPIDNYGGALNDRNKNNSLIVLHHHQQQQCSSGLDYGGGLFEAGNEDFDDVPAIILPSEIEYNCSVCDARYTSTTPCAFNPWWSLELHSCPKCGKSQFPWIDISLPSNQITHIGVPEAAMLQPEMMMHASTVVLPPPVAQQQQQQETVATTSNMGPPASVPPMMMPPVVQQPPPAAAASSTADSEEPTSSSSSASSSNDDIEFGDPSGASLEPEQAMELLAHMEHARCCSGKHESPRHAACCTSVKFVMLHVRDCHHHHRQCPFGWCPAVKHLVNHLVSCELQQDGCKVCACSTPAGRRAAAKSPGCKTEQLDEEEEEEEEEAAARTTPLSPKPVMISAMMNSDSFWDRGLGAAKTRIIVG